MFNPLEKDSSGFALTIPAAYRAWASWCNQQGFGGMQVARIHSSFAERTNPQDAEACLVALCEIYARAVMEHSIALAFSRVDSAVDAHVYAQIHELFSPAIALAVHDACAARGPVARSVDAIRQAVAESRGHTLSAQHSD